MSDFDKRLDEILTKLDRGEYLGEGGVDTARTAIRTLVLEEIIGENEVNHYRNHLRAEQRLRLGFTANKEDGGDDEASKN